MTRKEVKEMLPILQAFADGKEIESREEDKWYRVLEICNEMNPQDYRIKPEPKYRPFKNAEECLAEMQKHQLFGWVKNQGLYRNIANVMICSITFADNEARDVDYEQAFKNYTFADGAPFGVKVEEQLWKYQGEPIKN